jgi:hypothetical protein
MSRPRRLGTEGERPAGRRVPGGRPRHPAPDWAAKGAGGVALLLCAALGGCYTYRPVADAGPRPGATVAAGLTHDGSVGMMPWLGTDAAAIEGKVMTATPDTLRLAVATVISQQGIPASWRGEEVIIPRLRIAALSERRLSPGGTALLGAGVASGLLLIYRLIGGPGAFGSSGGGSGGGGR